MRWKDPATFTHKQLLLILIGLSYLFLMFGNGALSLTHPDEVFYIQTAKEMLNRSDWSTPYIFGQPQFEKPVFSYWLFMVAIKIFGLTPFAGRFMPALFGMIGVIAVYGIAWLMFRNKPLAFWSAVITMSCAIHLALSRAVLTDMIFSVWVTLGIGAFYWAYGAPPQKLHSDRGEHLAEATSKFLAKADERPKFKSPGIILSFAFIGIAVLTKGLLGICFPIGTILLFLLFRGDLQFLKTKSLFPGFLLFLIIVVPWHWAMYQRYGQEFLYEYFRNVHVRRLFVAEHERLNTWYFYLLVMVGGLFPWTIFSFSAVKLFAAKLKAKGKAAQPFQFLLAWIIGVVVFVQPAHSKLASYIFPLFPALAIIVGYYLENVLTKRDKAFEIAVYGLTIFLAAIVVGLAVAAEKYSSYIPDKNIVLIAKLLFSGVALFILWHLRKKNVQGVLAGVSLTLVALLGTVSLAIPIAEPWVSCKGISEMLQKTDQGNSKVLVSKFFVRGVKYYTDREVAVMDIRGEPFFSPHPISFLDDDTKVDQFLRSQPVTYCIVRHATLEDLEHIVRNGGFKMTRLGESGGKFLLKVENPKR